ncbi:unnamed protein product [Cyprideis torosa]|uniref:Uncharacterized protein n=1 Tax=Cyprideis torosa TaxID=163714 RepID=A0A7R8W4R9_9CRUS|nr:unnamed protein product [Cyprideis torosa]CAG0882117.1 unnamed protein product [Cyprideis torosa]
MPLPSKTSSKPLRGPWRLFPRVPITRFTDDLSATPSGTSSDLFRRLTLGDSPQRKEDDTVLNLLLDTEWAVARSVASSEGSSSRASSVEPGDDVTCRRPKGDSPEAPGGCSSSSPQRPMRPSSEPESLPVRPLLQAEVSVLPTHSAVLDHGQSAPPAVEALSLLPSEPQARCRHLPPTTKALGEVVVKGSMHSEGGGGNGKLMRPPPSHRRRSFSSHQTHNDSIPPSTAAALVHLFYQAPAAPSRSSPLSPPSFCRSELCLCQWDPDGGLPQSAPPSPSPSPGFSLTSTQRSPERLKHPSSRSASHSGDRPLVSERRRPGAGELVEAAEKAVLYFLPAAVSLGSVLPQNGSSGTSPKTHFTPVTTLEDAQAVRCAEFHPDGKVFAVGSNSKTLRLCAYPEISDLSSSGPSPANVLFKRTRHHKGSIYCMAWSPDGALLATGSNDKTVKLLKYNSNACNFDGENAPSSCDVCSVSLGGLPTVQVVFLCSAGHEVELTMHDGTVRDVCFIEDMSNQSSLLVSGGAGDCKIYVTDCATGTPFQALSGHSGHVLSLYTWGGAMFVSGSMDKSIRFWDLRTRGCVNVITPQTMAHPGVKGSPVASLAVDPSGRLLVSGHEDSTCVLFDFRGNRVIQTFSPHTADVRSIRFSPSAYYLLTAGYDNKLVLSDLQDDLTLPLPSIVVAEHQDKVISGRWHPRDFSFISTSADKTAVLWGLPAI